MSGRKNPGRAVMFSVCTNHCLGHLSLKAPPHLDHYQHREHRALRPTLADAGSGLSSCLQECGEREDF